VFGMLQMAEGTNRFAFVNKGFKISIAGTLIQERSIAIGMHREWQMTE